MKQQIKSDLLRQWKAGTISAEDKRKLELEALQDDFLFDAMEGYATNQSSGNLDALSERLEKRINQDSTQQKPRRMWYYGGAVAASIICIWLATWLINPEEKEYANKTERPTQEMFGQSGGTMADLADMEAEGKKEEQTLEEKQEMPASIPSDQGAPNKPKKSAVDDFMAQKPDLSVSKDESNSADIEEIQNDVEPSREEIAEERLPVGDLNYEDAISHETKVITTQNMPSEADAIREESYSTPTRSAKKKSKAAKPPQVVTSNAMEETEYKFRYEIAPENGWDAFDEYIEDTRQKSPGALRANIKGRVVVQFLIDDKGFPTNIEVIESNWSTLNEDAIQLIKYGGKWNTNDRTKPVRYIVEYP